MGERQRGGPWVSGFGGWEDPAGDHGEEIPGVHLVPAYAADSGAVLTQMATVGKGQELAAAKVLLGQIPWRGR